MPPPAAIIDVFAIWERGMPTNQPWDNAPHNSRGQGGYYPQPSNLYGNQRYQPPPANFYADGAYRSYVPPLTPHQRLGDSGSFGWAVLGFFLPPAGLICAIAFHRTRPRSARMARNGVLLNILAWFLMGALYLGLWFWVAWSLSS